MHLRITSSNSWKALTKQVKHPWKNLCARFLPFSYHHAYHDLIQFNSIDPAKINSHFGVRTDLFRRPLNETRITDFFGGVSQAEIVSSSNDPYPPVEGSVSDNSELHVQVQRESESTRFLHPSPAEPHKTLRAWGSILLLGIILGWVSSRKRNLQL